MGLLLLGAKAKGIIIAVVARVARGKQLGKPTDMICGRHIARSAPFLAGLVLLTSCSSTPHRPPPGEQEAFIVIGVPGVESVASEKRRYDCEGLPVSVEYINAGGVSLATLAFEEQFVVASNVLSASGARYAGNQYIWWSKGDEALFENLMDGTAQARQCLPTQAETEGRP